MFDPSSLAWLATRDYFVVPDLDLAGERHRRRALRPALRRSSVNGVPATRLTGLRQGDITMDHYQSSTLDPLQRHFDREPAQLEAEQVPRIRAALADQLDTLSLHDPLRGEDLRRLADRVRSLPKADMRFRLFAALVSLDVHGAI